MKWLWKKICNLWDDITYYFWDIPKTWYYDIKWFLGNFWRFRKQLWEYRTWDFCYCNDMFIESLVHLKKCLENGHEEDRSRNKKVKAIGELIDELKKISSDDDFGLLDEFYSDNHKSTEPTVDTDYYNNEYVKRKNETIDKITRLIKGQDQSVFGDKESSILNFHSYDEWVKLFDGTGYAGWWD